MAALRCVLFTVFLCGCSVFGSDGGKYDTIVIGLGSSGTMAASLLARAGRKVLALEAQDRIGGRVCTKPFGDGVVEVGAEWIHGTENSIVYDTAKNNSIEVKVQNFKVLGHRSDGSVADNQLLHQLRDLEDPVVGPDHPPQHLGEYVTASVKDFLKQNRPEVLQDKDYLFELLDYLNRSQCGMDGSNDWNDVTTAGKYRDLEGPLTASWHRNGYKTFFDILLNKYKNGAGIPNLEIKLKTEVTSINYSTGSVQVTTRTGETYKADNVIVTVSLGVLKERHASLFDPPLPATKVTAIEKMSIGTVDKVILSFPERWWPQNHTVLSFIWRGEERRTVSEEDSWLLKISGASSSMGASNVLVYWTTGDAAKKMESLPDSVVQEKIMWLTKLFFGKNRIIPDPIGILRSNWYSNPYTRGSYTFDNNETPNYPQARSDLGVPITDSSGTLRVLFAGEATNLIHYGTVHGAAETGVREAVRLLNGGMMY